MDRNYVKKAYYIVIPSFVIIISQLGRIITQQGMGWYQTIQLPWFTPPKWVFAPVWTFIFITTAIAAIMVWKQLRNDRSFWYINGLLIINGFLNLFWSYLFFIAMRSVLQPWKRPFLPSPFICSYKCYGTKIEPSRSF